MVRSEAHFRQAGRKIIVEAREGRALVPLATYQKARGIGAAVVEVARSVGRIFACVRPRGRPKVRSHPHGARRSGGIRCPLPFSLGDVGYGHAFPGVVDGRCARVVVERGTTGAGRGLKGRHFSDFWSTLVEPCDAWNPNTWDSRPHSPRLSHHGHGACRSGGIRCPLPFSLGDVGYGQAFPGVVDGRCARAVVERGTTGAERGLKGRHFSDF